MINYFILPFLCIYSLLPYAAAGCVGPFNSSLRVTLWDSFGDGWDDAYWLMNDPAGHLNKDQSTCLDIEKVFIIRPCEHIPAGGLYYMIVNTIDESLPEGWWEIYWRVEVLDSNGTFTGQSYEGVYNTTMIWEYDEVTDAWSLIHYDGIPNFECDGCSGGQCEAKPKPKKKKSKKSKKKLKGKKGDSESEEESSNNTSSYSDDVMKYGPRAVDLTVTMFGRPNAFGACNGWNGASRIGAHWYISDYTLTDIFDDGSLCEGCSGACNICLGDGSYVFRVTGSNYKSTSTHIAWEFCHSQGFFNDQLNFHVKKGKCIPDELRSVEQICDGQNTTVVLNGVMALGGVNSEFFTSRDYSLVISDLMETVDGWSTGDVSIVSTSLATRSLVSSERMLKSFTHDIVFKVSFIAEKLGVDGASYVSVQNLVDDMGSTLTTAFSSGEFTSKLGSRASLSGSDLLASVSNVQLLSLNIDSLKYENSRLVYYYDDDEVDDDAGSSDADGWSRSVVVAAVAVGLIGFIGFIGIMTHSFRTGYLRVADQSDHVQSEDQVDNYEHVVQSPFGRTVVLKKVTQALSVAL